MADEFLRSRHAFGNLVDVIAALEANKIDEHDILFLDGDTNPKIGWIDKNKNVRLVENECVIVVDGELPASGQEGKVYIFNDEGYFWNGTEFVNFCKPTDLTKLETDLLAKIEQAVKDVNAYADEKAETVKVYADEKVKDALDKVEHVYEKVKYEITDTPVGTLVKMTDDEIRIMCPKDAVFTKQSVGAGGDANNYYFTFKSYAPNDNVVGYIEHIGSQVDSEILTDLKTDKYGRKYQPTWLSLAKYDESTDTWNYYGKNSTKDKYVGWDYQIDWYDANNVMIGSNSIRINLANEDCYFTNEPYYVNNVVGNVDGKIKEVEKNAKLYTDEQIEAILSSFAIVEF